MRKILLLALVLALAVTGVSNSHSSLNAAPAQNNLIVGTNQEPDELNPWDGAADVKKNALALLNIGLTYFDSRGNLQPGLATEVPSPENGRVQRFTDSSGNLLREEVFWTIRPDAKWSDGQDITTDDVVFTLEVQKNKLIPVTFTTFSDQIQEIKVTDSKNFTIVYSTANLFFSYPGGHIGLARFYDIAPKHIWEPIFRKAIADAAANPGKEADTIKAEFLGAAPATGSDPTQVVGSGPFKFKEWQHGQFLTVDRRTDFFLQPPGDPKNYVQEATYQFFTATETLTANVINGAVDATDDIGLAGTDPANLQNQLGNSAKALVSPSGFIEELRFNNYKTCQIAQDLQLDNPKTRQAIIQAIDRVTLAPTVYPGGTLSNSFVVRGDLGFNDELNPWPLNLDNAKKLLADLGWTPGSDGTLQRTTADGRTVKFVLPHVATTASFRVRTQAFLQQDLAKVGIKLDPSNQPASVLFSNEFLLHASECSWGGIMEYAEQGGIGEAPSDPITEELAGDSIPTKANNFAGSNDMGWTDPKFEQLRLQALNEFDQAKRADLLKQMQVIFNDQLPFIPLYERTEIVTVKAGLVNYVKGTPLAATPFWNAWEWGWEQNGAKQVR